MMARLLAFLRVLKRALSVVAVVLLLVVVGAGVGGDLTVDYDGKPAAGLLSSGSTLVNPQQILLPVDSFWYPSDVQGFFSTDVTLTLPNTLTVVHNGVDATRVQRGTEQQVHWKNDR